MKNPFLVEDRFQQLVPHLEYPRSPQQQVHHITQFLQFLGPDLLRYQAYLMELCRYLPNLTRCISRSGIPPQQTHRLLRQLEVLEDQSRFAHLASFLRSVGELRTILAQLYAYGGGILAASTLLTNSGTRHLPQWIHETVEAGYARRACPRRTLRDLVDRAHQCSHPVAHRLEDLLSRWLPAELRPHLSTTIPTTEVLDNELNEPVHTGNLRKISIYLSESLHRPADAPISIEVPRPHRSNAKPSPVVAAVRNVFPTGFEPHYRASPTGHLWFHEASLLQDETTAQLGMAALLWNGLRINRGQSALPLPLHRTGFIGGLDATGEIQSVPAPHLCCQTEALYYSWAENLVVPAVQTKTVRAQLAVLKRRHRGARPLRIIGVKHLRDLKTRERHPPYTAPVKGDHAIQMPTRSTQPDRVAIERDG